MMELQNTVITGITGVFTVHLEKGAVREVTNRATYGLSLCKSGQVTYFHDGRAVVSDPEHAVLLPQGQSYSLRCDKEGDFPVINITTLSPLCETVTALDIPGSQFLMENYEALKGLFLEPQDQAKCMSILYDMLHQLSPRNRWGVLQNAVDQIYSSYHLPELSVGQLAQSCQISEVYFRRLFKEQFQVSPKQFVIDLRIQKARLLLSEGSLKIWAIGESCGFSTPYSFCRIFRQRTGMTPQEYRSRYKIMDV